MRKATWLWFGLLLLLGGVAGCAGSEQDGLEAPGHVSGDPTSRDEDGPGGGSTGPGAPAMPLGTGSAMGPSGTPPSDSGESGGGSGDFGNPAPAPSVPAISGAAGASAAPLPPSSDSGDPIDPSPVAPQPPAQSGQLTAGAWDDNLNYDRFSEYRSELLQSGLGGTLPTTDAEHRDAHELYSAPRGARQTLDVAIVIDTTGSMGDEITYLQQEIADISAAIEAQHPDAAQRWALVAYKDEGDSYVVQSQDFGSDVSTFRTQLSALSAGGGGDIPEAPDAALMAAAELSWRDEPTTARLLFWVADAPHHQQNAEAMADAVRSNAALDVHVYPVASSGIDELTELSMRSSAQLTGGRYLFLTNDSGIGNDHKEPTIPCYFVTRLDHAMLRMVDIELTGEYVEPSEEQIIRTGGDPQDGACTLQGGEEVVIF